MEGAIRFVRDGWAERAAALGWSELDLFGLHAEDPWGRHRHLGAAFTRFPAQIVASAHIVFTGTEGYVVREREPLLSGERVLLWGHPLSLITGSTPPAPESAS